MQKSKNNIANNEITLHTWNAEFCNLYNRSQTLLVPQQIGVMDQPRRARLSK